MQLAAYGLANGCVVLQFPRFGGLGSGKWVVPDVIFWDPVARASHAGIIFEVPEFMLAPTM